MGFMTQPKDSGTITSEHKLIWPQGTDSVWPARDPRRSGLGQVDVAQALVGGTESPRSTV